MSEALEGLSDRELDALFAERVLGRKVVNCAIAGRYNKVFRPEKLKFMPMVKDERFIGNYNVWWTEDGTRLYCGKPWAPKYLPRYTTSLDAAWEGVEKLGYYGKIEGPSRRTHKYLAALYNYEPTSEDEMSYWEAHDANPARAIVLACLKAVGE